MVQLSTINTRGTIVSSIHGEDSFFPASLTSPAHRDIVHHHDAGRAVNAEGVSGVGATRGGFMPFSLVHEGVRSFCTSRRPEWRQEYRRLVLFCSPLPRQHRCPIKLSTDTSCISSLAYSHPDTRRVNASFRFVLLSRAGPHHPRGLRDSRRHGVRNVLQLSILLVADSLQGTPQWRRARARGHRGCGGGGASRVGVYWRRVGICSGSPLSCWKAGVS